VFLFVVFSVFCRYILIMSFANLYCKRYCVPRFPDRSCLQGYFHPRHTIADVYEWVASCLVGSGGRSISCGGTSGDSSGVGDVSTFELYTSPPRTVLVPVYGISGSSTSGASSSDVPTLSSMKLVPAALMYLAWKGNHLKGSSGSGESVGGCFLPELLVSDGAVGKDGSSSSSAGSSGAVYAYPTGK